jgi:hypothetical protein
VCLRRPSRRPRLPPRDAVICRRRRCCHRRRIGRDAPGVTQVATLQPRRPRLALHRLGNSRHQVVLAKDPSYSKTQPGPNCTSTDVEPAAPAGLGLKPASMTLESVSACRPPTCASVASLRLDRCRGSTSGTHPAALTSPTRPGGYVDLECPPEDVGRYLSKRRVYPHAASWQGRSRSRPPRRRLDFYPYVGGRSTARRRHFATHAADRARRPACARRQAGRL